jgi:hypothetical protein
MIYLEVIFNPNLYGEMLFSMLIFKDIFKAKDYADHLRIHVKVQDYV